MVGASTGAGAGSDVLGGAAIPGIRNPPIAWNRFDRESLLGSLRSSAKAGTATEVAIAGAAVVGGTDAEVGEVMGAGDSDSALLSPATPDLSLSFSFSFTFKISISISTVALAGTLPAP